MSKAPDDMSPEEMNVVAKRFNEQQRQSTTMRRKIDQLDRELQDHVLVLQQLEPLDADRRCFRLIGGVLVERTVGEVRPLIDTQKGQLLELLNKMAEQLKVIEDEVRARRFSSEAVVFGGRGFVVTFGVVAFWFDSFVVFFVYFLRI